MDELKSRITELVGTASVCWDKDGVFDEKQALVVADELYRLVKAERQKTLDEVEGKLRDKVLYSGGAIGMYAEDFNELIREQIKALRKDTE